MKHIDKLRGAIARLEHYGAPDDNSPVYVEGEFCFYELLQGVDTVDNTPPRLTLADLRAIVAEHDGED